MGRLSNPSGVLNRVLAFVFCVLGPAESYADSLSPESYSVRSRISEKTLLGKDAPEDFEAQDVSANFRLPWLSGARWGLVSAIAFCIIRMPVLMARAQPVLISI